MSDITWEQVREDLIKSGLPAELVDSWTEEQKQRLLEQIQEADDLGRAMGQAFSHHVRELAAEAEADFANKGCSEEE